MSHVVDTVIDVSCWLLVIHERLDCIALKFMCNDLKSIQSVCVVLTGQVWYNKTIGKNNEIR